MRSLLYLINITLGASALYINPNGRTQNSTRLATRTDPSLSNVNHLASHLAKRTDPRFYDGDYGDNWDGVNKREALQDAFSDVYYMVLTALQTFDDTIFGHWFPARDRDKVFNVLRQVVGDDLNIPPGTAVGGDVLANFIISPWDAKKGMGDDDLCERGADAYTQNFNPSAGSDDPDYAIAFFCDKAFGTSEDDDVPLRLGDLECDNFFFDDTQRYRLTGDMDGLFGTILHEMMHFNSIGALTRLPTPQLDGQIFPDVAGPDPETDFGDPYWARQLVDQVTDNYDPCLLNADNYTWFVLEMVWTFICKDNLKDQGGYFDPLTKPPTDD